MCLCHTCVDLVKTHLVPVTCKLVKVSLMLYNETDSKRQTRLGTSYDLPYMASIVHTPYSNMERSTPTRGAYKVT